MPSRKTHLEQFEILDPNKVPPICVVGLGSVGSFITMGLVKLGVKEIIGFDPDRVEPHNIGNQFFSLEDNGMSKASALKERLDPYILDDQVVELRNTEWDGTTTHPITIASVDNLETRKDVYMVTSKKGEWLIDPRTGGEVWKVYAIKGENKNYLENEFDPATVERRCGRDGIVYVSMKVAQEVLLAIKRITNGEDVPFLRQGVER